MLTIPSRTYIRMSDFWSPVHQFWIFNFAQLKHYNFICQFLSSNCRTLHKVTFGLFIWCSELDFSSFQDNRLSELLVLNLAMVSSNKNRAKTTYKWEWWTAVELLIFFLFIMPLMSSFILLSLSLSHITDWVVCLQTHRQPAVSNGSGNNSSQLTRLCIFPSWMSTVIISWSFLYIGKA